MFWREVVASGIKKRDEEKLKSATDFSFRQGGKFEKGFSFSGYERDMVMLNKGDGAFLDVSGVSGLDSIGDGRAAVVADFDNDGDSDIFLAAMHGPAHLLFRNEIGRDAGFVRVALRGTQSGRDAFGAVVSMETSAGQLTKTRSGGAGFLAQPDPRLIFGLGKDPKAKSLRVVWPSGRSQEFPGPVAGESLLIVEGEATPRRVKEKRFSLPDPGPKLDPAWGIVQLRPGDAIPKPLLVDLDGEKVADTGIGKGETTVLSFWATWCASCRRELPELQKEYAKGGVKLVGLSVDRPDHREKVAAVAEKLGLTYPVYIAHPQWLKKIYTSDGVQVPLTIVVDGEGKVRDLSAGRPRAGFHEGSGRSGR